MSSKNGSFSRRDFLKTAGAVGIGSLMAPVTSLSLAGDSAHSIGAETKIVPTRSFGRTGERVSTLALGGAFHWSNLRLMKHAFDRGVTYWDTAPGYGNGQSEKAIGKYFLKFPEDRKKVFLVTKLDTFHPPSMTTSFENSLERMKTSYVDLLLMHGISTAYDMDNSIKEWAQKMKASAKIRFFGFSTHSNMASCLRDGAKLGWIDGIMPTYNFRVMNKEEMQHAVEACFKAGIGLTAMKTQATGWGSSTQRLSDREQSVLNQFKANGLTLEQAKLKVVWRDTRIASICSHMTNMSVLSANISAALDKKALSIKDTDLFEHYAGETTSGYCAGCASLCEPPLLDQVPISDVMRFLMYSRCYGEVERASAEFHALPEVVRNRMAELDYTEAERRCPQGMPIGRLMREAVSELA
jgi:predicted aldo/keto reductase-like oxidoreductase